ncbi:hypothetical protein [Frankia sp. AgB32]|uniref:hypothetical protein n=1 Tax=Frankia sp. AgB32 TaxID=631119 RepID=UPI00200DBFDA|nr:hypothetical protein [Frankia sp. AgB32]MCK9896274.1 hypothetical protein [Frankia sp. AgB32]
MDVLKQHESNARLDAMALDVEELEELVAAGWWKDFSSGFKSGSAAAFGAGTAVALGVGIGAAIT